MCRTSLRSNVRAGARGDLLDAAGVVFTSDLTTPASLTTTTEADPPAFVLLSAAMSGKQRTAAYSDACFSRSSREDMPGAGGFFSCDAIHDSIFSRRFREPCDSTRGGALQQRLAIEAPSGRYGQVEQRRRRRNAQQMSSELLNTICVFSLPLMHAV